MQKEANAKNGYLDKAQIKADIYFLDDLIFQPISRDGIWKMVKRLCQKIK